MAHHDLPHGPDLGTSEEIAKHYGMTVEELSEVLNNSGFLALKAAEVARLEGLGSRAVQQYRVEEMLGPLTERLFALMMDPECKLDSFVKGYTTLLASAGFERPRETGTASGVAVQINLPVLENGKLRHLQAALPEPADA
jgi:hypothetical protein